MWKMYSLNITLIVAIISTQVTFTGCINTSTVCYGVSGLLCTEHRLSCPSHLVIQIINTSYGYRPGCNDVIGLADCTNTTCCNEKPGDCFIPFSSEENKQVERNCSEVKTCQLSRLRRYNPTHTVCNGRIVSAYSKIQYDCVLEDTSRTSTETTNLPTTSATNTITSKATTNKPTTTGTNTRTSKATTNKPTTSTTNTITSKATTNKPTTSTTNTITYTETTQNEQEADDTSDVGSIVGGILGAIFIIVIIIAVVVFLYKRRRKSITPPATIKTMVIQNVTSKPQYYVIDGSGTNKTHNDTSGYDEIDLGDKPKIQATDNYDHIRDGKLKSQPPKKVVNYNHIENHNHDIHEDNYNHIGNNLSTGPGQFETDYDHINDVLGISNDEDDYNHIGNHDNKKVITDDNYHHIGSSGMQVEGDYNNIGSEELIFGSNDHYNHVEFFEDYPRL